MKIPKILIASILALPSFVFASGSTSIESVPMILPFQTMAKNQMMLAQNTTYGTLKNSESPDYILSECQETQSAGDTRSAFRAVDPGYMLKNYLQGKSGSYVELNSIKTTLLETTTHGKLLSSTSDGGRMTYHYDAAPNYTGKDKAVFIAEFMGKRYKIIIDLVVTPFVDESPLLDGEEPVCPPPKLIKAR